MPTPQDIAEDTIAPGEQSNDQTAAPGSKPNDSKSDDSHSQSETEISSLPEWAQREIRSLRSEAKDRRVRARDAEAAAKTAQEATMIEQNRYKDLAETRGQEIALLKPKAEQLEVLEAMFLKQYETETKDWPQDLLELAPAAEATTDAKVAWMERARGMANKLKTQEADPKKSAAPAGGNRRGPDPSPVNNGQTAAARADGGPLVDANRKF